MNQDLKIIISENIKRVRKQRGFTQGKMANILEVSQSTLSEIEKGNRSISAEQLITLLEKFNVTLYDFLQKKPPDIEDEIQNSLARFVPNQLAEKADLLPSQKITTSEEMIAYTLLFSKSSRHLMTIARLIAFHSASIQFDKILYELSKMEAEPKLFKLLNLVVYCLKKRLQTWLPKKIKRLYFFSNKAIENYLNTHQKMQKGIKNTIIEIKKGELIENLKEAENDV